MKKILFTLLILILLPLNSLAETEDNEKSDGFGSLLNQSETFDNPFSGQKQISDEDFQKTIDEIKHKNEKKLKRKDKPLKGKSYKTNDEGDYIDETEEASIILSLPLTLINGDGTVLPVGFYKVVGEKQNNKIFLNLYQAHSLMAKIPAIETNHDFDQSEINFIKILPYNEERIKIIFGSIDFNAYTFVKIKN